MISMKHPLLKLFFKECLLFKSHEIQNRIFGVTGWFSLAVFVYAFIELLKLFAF